jgi:hypothetical protein
MVGQTHRNVLVTLEDVRKRENFPAEFHPFCAEERRFLDLYKIVHKNYQNYSAWAGDQQTF